MASNEYGDAELLHRKFQGKIIFDCIQNQWYIYENHKWVVDTGRNILHAVAVGLVEEYQAALEQADPMYDNPTIRRHINKLKTAIYINKVLELAKTMDGLKVIGNEWNQNKNLICCEDGFIELYPG